MKTTILTTLFLCFFFKAHCQLDSVSVAASFEADYVNPVDSAILHNALVLTFHFDDIADLGYLNVAVYDAGSNAAIGEYVRTRQELTDEGLLLSDRVEWGLFSAEPGTTYRIEVSPRNISGAYTRIVTISATN